MHRLRQTFSSLRNRNYRLFFIGQTISNTGNWLTNVALVLLVLKLTGNSGVAVGFLAACQYGPALFFSAWAGALADRVDKQKMLLLTQSLEMAQSIGLAVLAFMPHPSIPALYILALWGGIFLAFDNPARRSFVGEMVPKEDLSNAVVLYSTIVNVSRIFGPALAGILVVTVGYGWAFSLDAASYIAVLICLVLMRTDELHRDAARAKMKGEIREGFRYILSVPLLWVSFVMLFSIFTLAYNFTVTLPLFVSKALGAQDSVYTILYSVFSCGAVFCALLIAHRSRIHMGQILFGAGALGILLLLLSIAPNVFIAIPIMFGIGMASILYTNTTTAIVQIGGRRDMRGRVLSLQTTIILGTAAIGGPLLGWIADIAGARILMVIGGVTCLAACAFGYAMSRYYKSLDF